MKYPLKCYRCMTTQHKLKHHKELAQCFNVVEKIITVSSIDLIHQSTRHKNIVKRTQVNIMTTKSNYFFQQLSLLRINETHPLARKLDSNYLNIFLCTNMHIFPHSQLWKCHNNDVLIEYRDIASRDRFPDVFIDRRLHLWQVTWRCISAGITSKLTNCWRSNLCVSARITESRMDCLELAASFYYRL